MLTQEDIKKIVKANEKAFATKKDLEDFKESILAIVKRLGMRLEY